MKKLEKIIEEKINLFEKNEENVFFLAIYPKVWYNSFL